MTKRIHLDFLQYLLDHMNPDDRHFNRYFVLKSRLSMEYGYFQFRIDAAKCHLLKAGFLGESRHPGQLSITEEGIKFLHQENRVHLMSWLEKFTQLFDKKYSAITMVLGSLIAAGGLYYNAQKKPTDSLSQFITVSIVSIKQSIFN